MYKHADNEVPVPFSHPRAVGQVLPFPSFSCMTCELSGQQVLLAVGSLAAIENAVIRHDTEAKGEAL